MIIKISSLNEGTNRWEEKISAAKEGLNEIMFPNELNIELDVTKGKNRLEIFVSVFTLVHFECDRCGIEFDEVMGGNISVSFIQRNEPFPDEMPGDDLRSYLLGQDEIDISSEIRDAVLLSIPMKVICDEDCQGICFKCKANLNIEQCRCETYDDI